MRTERRGRTSTVLLAAYYGLFLLFLYGPMLVMIILSLQGSRGGATFPARDLVNFFWYDDLGSASQAAVREAIGTSLIMAGSCPSRCRWRTAAWVGSVRL